MRGFRLKVVPAALALLVIPTVWPASQSFTRFRKTPFELSVSQKFGDEGQALLVVSVTIPHKRLVFFKEADGFDARYRVYMDLRDRKDKLVSGEVWEESVSVDDYQETKSNSAASTSRRAFPVLHGEYMVKVTVEVINTSLSYTVKKDIRILERGEGRLEISDPVFSTPTGDMPGNKPPAGEIVFSLCPMASDVHFKMNADGIYADFGVWPHVAYNLVTPGQGAPMGGYVVSTRVTDSEGRVVLYGRSRVQSTETGHQLFCVDFGVDDFAVDEYEISTVVEAPGTDERSAARGVFIVLLNEGALSRNFEQTIKILSYIAEARELAALKNAPPGERMDAWRRFWKARDPNPATEENEAREEFLRRLLHVLKSFSDFRPGWETARGRTFIRHGEPDNIEDRYGGTINGNYQLWYYYSKNIVFIFVDSFGTGDYQLLTTRSI